MDFIRHYRPMTNVVHRPTSGGGHGYNLVGHHEIMLPLLAAGIIELLDGWFQAIHGYVSSLIGSTSVNSLEEVIKSKCPFMNFTVKTVTRTSSIWSWDPANRKAARTARATISDVWCQPADLSAKGPAARRPAPRPAHPAAAARLRAARGAGTDGRWPENRYPRE